MLNSSFWNSLILAIKSLSEKFHHCMAFSLSIISFSNLFLITFAGLPPTTTLSGIF